MSWQHPKNPALIVSLGRGSNLRPATTLQVFCSWLRAIIALVPVQSKVWFRHWMASCGRAPLITSLPRPHSSFVMGSTWLSCHVLAAVHGSVSLCFRTFWHWCVIPAIKSLEVKSYNRWGNFIVSNHLVSADGFELKMSCLTLKLVGRAIGLNRAK